MSAGYKPVKKNHGPNRLDEYLKIHDQTIATYYSMCTNDPHYTHQWIIQDAWLKLRAKMIFAGGIRLHIEKDIAIQPGGRRQEAMAQTETYSYHVDRSTPDHRPIVRYDGPDERHPTHHKHEFDLSTGLETQVLRIEDGEQPHISDVIRDEILARFGNLPP